MQTKKMIPVHNSQVLLQIMKVLEAIYRPQIMQDMQSLVVPMSGGPAVSFSDHNYPVKLQ